MVNRTFEFILSRSQWRNFFKNMLMYVSVLVYLFLVGIGVKGDITNDQQGNGTGTWHPYNAEARQGPYEYNTVSFPQHNTASYPDYNTAPFPAANQDHNLKNADEYQRPYHHRQHNYRHQNYDNRPHYRQNFARNGTETEYQPHQQRYHRRGHRQYNRDENAHDRQYDNGNYTTYYNDYNPYVPADQHQYYYDPSYVAPPYEQQNYAYQPEQYYYNQPAVQPNDAFGYNDPQYDQQLNYHQQPYYNHQQQQQPQQQYNQDFQGRHQFTPEAQSSVSDAQQSVSRKRTTVRKQKSKSTNTTKTTSTMEKTIATQVTARGTAKTSATTAKTATTTKTATTAKTAKTTASFSTYSVWNVRSDTPRQLYTYQQLQGLVHPFPQIHPNPQQWDPNYAEPSYYAEPYYDPQIYAQYPTQYFPHIQSDQQQQQQWNPYPEQFYPGVNQSSSYPFPLHHQTDAPQQWDPNVNPVFEPQYDNHWYPDNNPNNPAQWQAHDPNQYWPPADNQYQQPEQRQHIIDWQVFDLNYDEVPIDFTQQQSLQPQQWQQKTRKITTKQETTERNYNTFGPEELRDRTSTVNDSINYNTYSDRELKELQGMQEKSRHVDEEYAEYDTSELEEDDSDETRNYNTLDPTNATTKPTKEINYNTYAPEELLSASQPKDINFNTHGHKPYFHTDPHSAEKLYKEYPITRNLTANKPSDHTPIARQSEYFATAKPPIFDFSNYKVWVKNQSTTPRPRLLDIKVSLTTSTIEQQKIFVDNDHGNTKSESFLNRWLFGRKTPQKSTRPPPLSNNTSFFYSDQWTVYGESQSTKEGQIPRLLDLVVSPITPIIAQEMYDGDNYESSISKSFLDRWLFGKKRTTRKSTRVPSTFDHRSFFASPSTSDHWLLSSHRLKSSTSITDSKVFDSNENEPPHSSEARSREEIPRLIPATPSAIHDNYESVPWPSPLYTYPSLNDDIITDITTPRITPATPSSSVDGLSRKIKSRTRSRHHKHNRTHDHHDQIEVDCTRPMSPQPIDDFTLTKSNSSQRVTKRKYKRKSTHTDSHQLHLDSSNEHLHSRQTRKRSSNSTKRKAGSRQKRQGIRYARDISSDSDYSSPENKSSPLDVSDAQEYCAWANQQRYLLSIERRAKEDRQNQKFSRPPMFKQISFRKVNPEYMKTPYWTGSTSYVWMDGGKKKKVIDLPDESYGLLIEDSEEWWQQQWREAKSLRAYKYLGLNREGYRKSRLEDQEEQKKSKLGRLFGHVKSFFRKITGRKEKENDLKKPDDQQPDHNEERRSWDRTDRKNPNYRPQQRNPIRTSNYRNPNYRYHQHNPDHSYQPDQNYKNPNANYNNPNYGGNADPNSNNPPSRNSDNQRYYKNNENRRFNYKPFHYTHDNNFNNPDHRANKPNYRPHYRQADANSVNDNNPQFYHQSTSMYVPPYENSNTRRMD